MKKIGIVGFSDGKFDEKLAASLLEIAIKIVEEHEGLIHIENIKPHGAQISIILPTVEKNKSAGNSKLALS